MNTLLENVCIDVSTHPYPATLYAIHAILLCYIIDISYHLKNSISSSVTFSFHQKDKQIDLHSVYTCISFTSSKGCCEDKDIAVTVLGILEESYNVIIIR